MRTHPYSNTLDCSPASSERERQGRSRLLPASRALAGISLALSLQLSQTPFGLSEQSFKLDQKTAAMGIVVVAQSSLTLNGGWMMTTLLSFIEPETRNSTDSISDAAKNDEEEDKGDDEEDKGSFKQSFCWSYSLLANKSTMRWGKMRQSETASVH